MINPDNQYLRAKVSKRDNAKLDKVAQMYGISKSKLIGIIAVAIASEKLGEKLGDIIADNIGLKPKSPKNANKGAKNGK